MNGKSRERMEGIFTPLQEITKHITEAFFILGELRNRAFAAQPQIVIDAGFLLIGRTLDRVNSQR